MSTAAGITVSGATEVFSVSCSVSGGDVIDVTPINQGSGARLFKKTPIGGQFEATISAFGSVPAIGSNFSFSGLGQSFDGVVTSVTSTAAVNDVARFEATIQGPASAS